MLILFTFCSIQFPSIKESFMLLTSPGMTCLEFRNKSAGYCAFFNLFCFRPCWLHFISALRATATSISKPLFCFVFVFVCLFCFVFVCLFCFLFCFVFTSNKVLLSFTQYVHFVLQSPNTSNKSLNVRFIHFVVSHMSLSFDMALSFTTPCPLTSIRFIFYSTVFNFV